MACAKFCSNMISYNGVSLKPIFHQIWIMMENHLWNGPRIELGLFNTLRLSQNGHNFVTIFKCNELHGNFIWIKIWLKFVLKALLVQTIVWCWTNGHICAPHLMIVHFKSISIQIWWMYYFVELRCDDYCKTNKNNNASILSWGIKG